MPWSQDFASSELSLAHVLLSDWHLCFVLFSVRVTDRNPLQLGFLPKKEVTRKVAQLKDLARAHLGLAFCDIVSPCYSPLACLSFMLSLVHDPSATHCYSSALKSSLKPTSVTESSLAEHSNFSLWIREPAALQIPLSIVKQSWTVSLEPA